MNTRLTTQLCKASRRGFWPAVTALTAIAAVASAFFGLQIGTAEAEPRAVAAFAAPVAVVAVAHDSIKVEGEVSGQLDTVRFPLVRRYPASTPA